MSKKPTCIFDKLCIVKYLPSLRCKHSISHFESVNKRLSFPDSKHSQISLEYIVILGFVMMVLIVILGIALFYSASIKDRIKIIQVNNFGDKIISTAESVYYYGEPSKATISVYLPDGVKNITVLENSLFISTEVYSGEEKRSFLSNVPLEGAISSAPGIKKIVVKAEGNKTIIDSV